jgi:methionyl-tRNA formyltransferase
VGAAPGTILAARATVRVVCGGGSLSELGNVKLEGRKEITAAEFANGARLQAGERFGKQ